jgi:hypothetical protein
MSVEVNIFIQIYPIALYVLCGFCFITLALLLEIVDQVDQIGRIFAYWVFFSWGSFMKIC